MIELLHTDCMDYMAGVEDKAFDLAIVDPPYGIGDFTRKRSHGQAVNRTYSVPTWNDSTPEKEYFLELERVSKRRIIWGANYFNCFKPGGALVWYKNIGAETISSCEIASLSFQKKVDYVRVQLRTGFYGPDRIHPCQKPVKLYKYQLEKYAKPGDKILDTHHGSGSLAIACHYMGFDMVACEIDKKYYEDAKKRFREETKQVSFL
ncbi:MAG: site-specific DNA-methyltransferase [Deltaproteobacteria bacterium]|nr:site-specific DNA-methyltransferase [Deltaproteobacteria bacterium]